jgi:hypothetical protein
MTRTAKDFITAYFNYRFFEDNFSDASVKDENDAIYNDMVYFKGKYEDIKETINKKDFTNNIEDQTYYLGVGDREGFK